MKWGAALLLYVLMMGAAQAQDSDISDDLPIVPTGTRPAPQDNNIRADRVLSGDVIALQDGRSLRLAGIKAWDGAREFLQQRVAGQVLVLQDVATDRYGRVTAIAFLGGEKQSLQDMLLSAGQAYVYPAVGDVAAWLAEEKSARRGKHGAWPDHPDMSADQAVKNEGQYGFVSGIVINAEKIKGRLVLNFGADPQRDFTICILSHDLRAFHQADLDPLDWQGKKLRVRGWIKREEGPMIQVTDPNQIEIMN